LTLPNLREEVNKTMNRKESRQLSPTGCQDYSVGPKPILFNLGVCTRINYKLLNLLLDSYFLAYFTQVMRKPWNIGCFVNTLNWFLNCLNLLCLPLWLCSDVFLHPYLESKGVACNIPSVTINATKTTTRPTIF
jgi:hypothetical protein